MKLTITINCDNEAFTDNPGLEIARILHLAADRIDGDPISSGGDGFRLFDLNGNRVGLVEITD